MMRREALAGEPDLPPLERRVWRALPRGHDRAIGLRSLAEVTGLNQRTVRDIIHRLIVDYGLPIGSSTDQHSGGYFVIETEADLRVAVRHLKPRALHIFRRVRALEKLAERRWNIQLRLFEDLEVARR